MKTAILIGLVFFTMINIAATEDQIRKRRWPKAASSVLLALFIGATTIVFWSRGL